MYLRFESDLSFAVMAALLNPELAANELDYDSENVYEWMYLPIPGLPFLLNISREHGWADVDDEDDPISPDPGPVVVFGWEQCTNCYVDEFPDWVPQHFADQLGVTISLHEGRVNDTIPIPTPIRLTRPRLT